MFKIIVTVDKHHRFKYYEQANHIKLEHLSSNPEN